METTCPHLSLVLKVDKENLLLRSEKVCNVCQKKGKLWACLQENCPFNGCGESVHDHSTKHYLKSKHAIAVNLKSFRIWCYACKDEVHLPAAFTPADMKCLRDSKRSNLQTASDSHVMDHQPLQQPVPSQQQRPYSDISAHTRGLTGLRNMGNTCYMNAALQAISNCPALTHYFLNGDGSILEKDAAMARNFFQLMRDMWGLHPHPPIAPRGIHNTLKAINPSFRGYHQQDAQEFLRCFMDRLHEEMKNIIPRWTYSDKPASSHEGTINAEEEHMEIDEPSVANEVAPSVNFVQNQSDSFTIVSESLPASQQTVPSISAATPHVRRVSTGEDSTLHGSDPTSNHHPSLEQEPSPSHNKAKMKHPNRQPRPSHKPAYRYRSVISDIFDGELRSSVQCLTCDQVSHTRETFQDLSLPIPGKDDLVRLHGTAGLYTSAGSGALAVIPGFKGPCSENTAPLSSWYNYAWDMWDWLKSWFWGPQVNLNDCLSAFFSADELKGDNMYSCNKCNKLRNGVKYCKLLQLPEVLCIHLKRFRHEYQMSYSSKISSPVSFPITGLDLRQFLAQDSPSSCTKYELCSIIVHLGNAGGGHYTAYAKNFGDENWYEFDDQYVTEVSESVVASAEAYVLFYKKSSVEAMRAQDRILQIHEASLNRAQNSSDLLNFYISLQWLEKFMTFAEPGPIDNSDFLCRHSGLSPTASDPEALAQVVSETTWQELHKRFGGGPAVTSLTKCDACENEYRQLCERRNEERENFRKLCRYQSRSTPHVYICHDWFREWEDFVNEKLPEPPGKIDNWPICYLKEGKHVLRKNSPHAPIPKKAWDALVSIYGGGPEVAPIVRPTSVSPNKKMNASNSQTPTSPPEHKNRDAAKQEQLGEQSFRRDENSNGEMQ